MTEISPALVKNLRERTGAGMMDCKKALVETDGNIDDAIDWLRKKGLSAAAKKADRIASEGLIGAYAEANKAAIVEVNAETDFVGRNDLFQSFVKALAKGVLQHTDQLEELKTKPFPDSDKNFADQLTHLIATIGENMSLRRVAKLTVNEGVVATYIHNAVAPQLGRIGVLVALESAGNKDRLLELANNLAMHIAAVNPQSLKIEDLNPTLIQKERELISEQARASGRPDNVIEKMIEGRLRKFYEEVVLNEQTFVMDSSKRIDEVVQNLAKELGTPIHLKAFIRYELGEGIEKAQSNFAEEVAAPAFKKLSE